jgi:hypothetical protein
MAAKILCTCFSRDFLRSQNSHSLIRISAVVNVWRRSRHDSHRRSLITTNCRSIHRRIWSAHDRFCGSASPRAPISLQKRAGRNPAGAAACAREEPCSLGLKGERLAEGTSRFEMNRSGPRVLEVSGRHALHARDRSKHVSSTGAREYNTNNILGPSVRLHPAVSPGLGCDVYASEVASFASGLARNFDGNSSLTSALAALLTINHGQF